MLPKDPVILLSYVNTKLRDDYPTLDALCDDLEADRAALEASAVFFYTRSFSSAKLWMVGSSSST